MIVDGHAHAFPFLGDASGYSTAEEHRKVLQRHFSTHRLGARRVSDNAVVTRPTLWDGETPGFDGLLDVNFRVGSFGRFEWETDGVEYYIQWLPPSLEDNTARPQRMLAQMDALGVGRAMLQCGPLYGRLDDYLSAIVRQYPDRFRACFQIVESELDGPGQIEYAVSAVRDHQLTALYFTNDTFANRGNDEDFSADQFVPFWEAIEQLGVPVLWDIRLTQATTHEHYLRESARLHRFVRRFPNIHSVLTHGVPSNALVGGEVPTELLALLMEDNVTLELVFPILYGGVWDYPYPDAVPIIRQLYDRIGGGKMLWGSDMPNVERGCTYRQSLTYLTDYCTFIKSADMDRIIGGTANELYFSQELRTSG